jgi:hypothetical protein
MSEYFQPAGCDELGNTHFPWILKGIVSKDGYTVEIEEPEEFKASWPDVATSFVASSDDTTPRRLTPDEVKALVAQRRPSIREKLRAENRLGL